MLSLILALSPVAYAHHWQSPDYRRREAASAQVIRLGYRSAPVLAPLLNHRNAEVRHRARRAFAATCLVRRPIGAADVPHYCRLAEVAPKWLRFRLTLALSAGYVEWPGLDRTAPWEVGRLREGERDFTLEVLDRLVWRGFPPRWAQSWLDGAAELERPAKVAARAGEKTP